MRRAFHALLAVSLILGVSAQAHAQSDTLIADVTIVDVAEGTLTPDQSVLIRDIINPDPRQKLFQTGGPLFFANLPARLCKIRLTTPDCDVQRTAIRAVDPLDDEL